MLRGSSVSAMSSTENGTETAASPRPQSPETILKNLLTIAMNDCYTCNASNLFRLPVECLNKPNIVLPDTEKSLLSHVPGYTAMIAPIHGSSNDYKDISLIAVLGINRFREMDETYRYYFDLLVSQLNCSLSTTTSVEQSQQRADELAELNRSKTTFFSVSHSTAITISANDEKMLNSLDFSRTSATNLEPPLVLFWDPWIKYFKMNTLSQKVEKC